MRFVAVIVVNVVSSLWGCHTLYCGREVPTLRRTGWNRNEHTMVLRPMATPIKFNMFHEDTQVFLIIGSKYMI
jgi:Na+-transporting NADH:ubiquinone oxidoreductase subunit NqrD